MSDETYEVFAVAYAYNDRRAPENFIGGDPHDVAMPLNYYVWVIRGGGRTLVVDTGFDQRAAEKRGREIRRPVREGLEALGVAPGTVEDVIITHMHYDHSGNDGLFPNARFHLQDREMAFTTGRSMCHQQIRHAYELDDVTAMVRRVFSDQVVFHDGDGALLPGVSLHFIGGHTRGLQSVRVKTARGWVMLASDASHHYAHILDRRVFPIVYNVAEVLEGYRRLESLASSKQHVVPGHDPLVTEIYPALSPETEGWIVRLDVEPKPLPDR